MSPLGKKTVLKNHEVHIFFVLLFYSSTAAATIIASVRGLSGVAGHCSIPSLVALGLIPCQCIVDCRLQYRVGW
jgi:hypothetical protein